jgi:hypothetical protein
MAVTAIWGTGGREFKSPRSDQSFQAVGSVLPPLVVQMMSELRRRRLVFHGLRKSAVVFLLEAGCSDAETASITLAG